MQILYNGRIYTGSHDRPQPTALIIDHDRIRALGRDDEMLAAAAAASEKIDLQGKTVWPGLIDAHLHLEYYAHSLRLVECETATLQECLERVAQRAQAARPGEWILGHGWNQNVWAEGFGSAAHLDQVAPRNPVYLTTKSWHAAWVNTLALQTAGITAETPDPRGGVIQRDANGQPTGILFEVAMQRVHDIIPQPTLEATTQAVAEAQTRLWQMGLTGLHDFDRRSCFSGLQALHSRGQLNLRVLKSIPLEDLDHAIGLGLHSGFGDDTLRIGAVKLFADGALGPQTAAMLQPYESRPDNLGILSLDAGQIIEIGRRAGQNGLSLAIHAIGDRANHEVLNAFEQLRAFERQNNLSGLRHRIEHVQLLDPADLERLAQNDLIASMQPLHATSDMDVADRHWGKRCEYAYAWRSLLETGARLAFGSDAPVENPNPFWGLHAAVTRRRSNGQPGPDGWQPGQRLNLHQALAAFSSSPAYAAGLENRLGRLAPGFLADLIILDKDPFALLPHEICNIQPEATMVGGKWVWQS